MKYVKLTAMMDFIKSYSICTRDRSIFNTMLRDLCDLEENKNGANLSDGACVLSSNIVEIED